jgi:hypothetical protein
VRNNAKRERRSAARYECELPVALRLLDNLTIRAPAMSRDIGSGGIFLYSNVVPALGERIAFTLKLPHEGRKAHFLSVGRVVRVEEVAGYSGLAVSFEDFALF